MQPDNIARITTYAADASAAIERVRALHFTLGTRWVGFPRANREEPFCAECYKTMPCPTIRALDGTDD